MHALENRHDRGLYVHIPFCASKCAYCDFYSLPDRAGWIHRYVNAVHQEAGAHAGMRFRTLYLGGGTPSVLGPASLTSLLAGLKRVFDLSGVEEASLEANPESATAEFFDAAQRHGITRVSIGVQSLDDRELKAVGRIHSAARALEAIREAGSFFAHVSADIIVGLPGQTPGSLQSSIDRLLAAGVEHVSLYCLSVEEGTPLAAHLPPDLPDDDEQADLFQSARAQLLRVGFHHYEISNFAVPGRECRHNLNYWRGGEYLGLGPGAASHLNGKRYRNRPDLEAYLRQPDSQVEDTEELTPSGKAAEEAMLRLRLLTEGVSSDTLAARFGASRVEGLLMRLQALAGEEELVAEGAEYRLSERRILTANQVLCRVLGDDISPDDYSR